MVLSWYGGQCLLVEERVRGEASRAVLFFPHTKTSRTRTLEGKAQVIVTAPGAPKATDGAFRITTPGEYDVAGFSLRGIFLADEATAFVVEAGELAVCVFPEQLPDELRDRDIESIGEVDIFVVPAFSSTAVGKVNMLIREIEPKVVLPLVSDTKLRASLAREVGKDAESMEKFSVAQKDLAEEGVRLIFLQA